MDESQGIVGQMTLDLNGAIKSSSGTLTDKNYGPIIDKMMQETATLLHKDEVFNRITINFTDDEFYIYYDQIQLCVVHKKKL